jgi:flavin reductase (DIM6/NTAB) family NADH-FMN oxidoreductase RutF
MGSDGAPHGITMNSFTSVSADPPMVLVCVDHRSRVLEHFQNSFHFGVNVLSEHQQEMSQRFARSTSDRFQNVGWYAGKTGVPLLPEVLATFECRLADNRSVGDHLVLIGEVLFASYSDGYPLAYFGSSYRKVRSDFSPEGASDLWAAMDALIQ